MRTVYHNLWLSVAGTCLSFCLVPGLGAGDLTTERFEQLHKEIQPAKDAAWRTIPWQLSLLDAQRIAAKQRKPIFIWAMDGHPLGCT
jgi:hypothetical protein